MEGHTLIKCKVCGELKNASDYYICKRSKSGRMGKCKECVKAYRRGYEQTPAYKEAKRRWRMKNDYGISLATYDDMLSKQGGRCYVCGVKPFTQKCKGSLCVDHCHSTGTIRGLLCTPCNQALGLLEDNPEYITKLQEYLEEYQ